MRQLGDAHRKPLDPLGDIMRGGLALERGVHRQHDLVYPARFDPADERIERQILGPHAFERCEPTAKPLEFAGEKPGTFERPTIGDVPYHEERPTVRPRTGAK